MIPHQARLKVGGDVCGQFQRPDLEEAPRSGDGLTVRDEVTGSDMSQPRQCHRGQPSCVKTPCTTNPNTGYALVHSFWDYDSKCVPSVCLSEHPLHLAAAQLNTTLGGQAFWSVWLTTNKTVLFLAGCPQSWLSIGEAAPPVGWAMCSRVWETGKVCMVWSSKASQPLATWGSSKGSSLFATRNPDWGEGGRVGTPCVTGVS